MTVETVTIQENNGATTAPTTTDDTNAGYSVGSRWLDTTNDKVYICIDATASAAVWRHVSAMKVVQMALEDLTSTGDGQQNFVVPVPEAGWVLKEVRGELRTAGTALTIQIRELNASRVSQGDVLSSVLSFGATTSASTTSFVAGRTTPGKDFSYTIDIDSTTGSPAGLTLQLRFRAE